MALFKCLDCSHDVSDLAISCPHCGRPVSTMMPQSSETAPVLPPAEPTPSVTESDQDQLESVSAAPATVPEGLKPAAKGSSIAIFVLILIAMGLAVVIAKGFGKHAASDKPATDNQTEAPLSASDLFAKLQAEQSAGQYETALRLARELIAAYQGTPEEKRAASLLPELEAATQKAQEAEQAQRAEAQAEAAKQLLAAKWSYRAEEDPMTSRKARYASIESENALTFDFPYQGEQHGQLLLRDHPSHGRDVMVLITKGQILCPSYDGCTVRVRFDEGSPQRWSASGPADNSTTVVFLRNEGGFIQKLRNSKVVRIEIPVYQEGQPMLEFQVGGFDYSRFKLN